MLCEFFEDLWKTHLKVPVEITGSAFVVHGHPRNVIRALFQVDSRGMAPEAFIGVDIAPR